MGRVWYRRWGRRICGRGVCGLGMELAFGEDGVWVGLGWGLGGYDTVTSAWVGVFGISLYLMFSAC